MVERRYGQIITIPLQMALEVVAYGLHSLRLELWTGCSDTMGGDGCMARQQGRCYVREHGSLP